MGVFRRASPVCAPTPTTLYWHETGLRMALSDTSGAGRRWNRGSWLTLSFVLGLMLLNIGVTILVLRQPSEGCIVDHPGGLSQIVRACYGERPTPLRPGDGLIAAGGAALVVGEDEFSAQAARPAGWVAGATIDYTVRRGRETLALPVPIDPLPWAGVVQLFAYSATADAGDYVLYVGFLLIFLLAPQSVAARALFVCFGAHFAVTKLGWAGGAVIGASVFQPGWLRVPVFFLTSFWVWVYWPSLLLLVLSFPRQVWPVAHAPRLVTALIYAVPTAAALFTLATNNPLPYGVVLFSQMGLLLVAFVIVPIHTFLRVRDRAVRAQTGWLLLSLGVNLVPVVIFYSISRLDPDLFERSYGPFVTSIIAPLFTALTPLSLGIAITRYRLFDIDIIIRRTLVYAVLTLTLAGAYLLGVVGLQALFVRFTGQESSLAVVASTLVIAALFQPLRTRVQAFIDRRFFRRKYDAQQVLAAFAQRAQQEADLDTVSADLLGTVQEALEPEAATLWLIRRP